MKHDREEVGTAYLFPDEKEGLNFSLDWQAGVVVLSGVHSCAEVLECTCNLLATRLQLACNSLAIRFLFVSSRVDDIMYFEG